MFPPPRMAARALSLALLLLCGIAACDAKDGALKAYQAECAAATVLLQSDLEASRAEASRLAKRLQDLQRKLATNEEQQTRDFEGAHRLISQLWSAACARHEGLRSAAEAEGGVVSFERLGALLAEHFGVRPASYAPASASAAASSREAKAARNTEPNWHALALSPVREWR